MYFTRNYKSILFAFLLLLIYPKNLFSAHGRNIEEGKSAAMANTSVTLIDIWAIYHNQAGLGYLENISVGVFHQSGFIEQQNIQGISFVVPTKTGTLGASYSYYGYNQYNEMQTGLAYGKSFSKYFSIGLQLNYLNTHIAGNYGNSNSVNFEIGVLSQPLENLSIGAHVYNPSRSKIGNEEIPTVFNLGLSYIFSEKVLLAIGTEKNLKYDAIFKAGIHYQLIKYVSLQAGVSTNPSKYSFGIGLYYTKVHGHIGFSKHQTLGYTPSFTLSYDF